LAGVRERSDTLDIDAGDPDMFDLYSFLDPLFTKFTSGRSMRMLASIVLKVLAALAVLSGLILLILALRAVVRSDRVGEILGFLVLSVFCVAWTVCHASLLAYRAGTIARLPDGRYSVIWITSVMARLTGEACVVLFGLLGVGGCLFMWLAEANPLSLMLPIGAVPGGHFGVGFLGGLWFLFVMLLLAFAILMWTYLFAEVLVAIPDMVEGVHALKLLRVEPCAAPQPSVATVRVDDDARLVKATRPERRADERVPLPVRAPSVVAPPPLEMPPQVPTVDESPWEDTVRLPPVAPTSTNTTCHHCGVAIDPGARFCEHCGKPQSW
jgi:hypothetical protein